MSAISYTVTATLPDEQTLARYVAWLRGGHVQAVVDGGAESGAIVRVTDPPKPLRVQTRYLFASAASFDRYEREFAPGLRADGLARFGPETGVTFERAVGVVL